MGRRNKRGRRLHGILLLDKPPGGSSNKALQRVKRLFDAQKAGHTGSLDPLATGMLPICFGEATKLSSFLLDAHKGYETTFQLGVTTDSADSDGEILDRRAIPDSLTRADLESLCERFTGDQLQVPPMVSAIKIDGQRLYKLAREGITVERAARPVCISAIELLDFDGEHATLSVRCSKGTYIRSLVTDLGEAIGCGAHVTALRRIFVAPFEGTSMVSITELESALDASEPSALDHHLLPLDAGLDHLVDVSLTPAGVEAFCRGQPAQTVEGRISLDADAVSAPLRVYDTDRRLIGLGTPAPGGLAVAPSRVIQW